MFQDAKAADSTYEALCEKAVEANPGPQRLEALRGVSASDLLKFLGQDRTMSFAVERSPKAIWTSASICEKLEEGEWGPHIKSVMVGVTKDEGSVFALVMQTHKPAGYEHMFKTMVTRASREEVDSLYTPAFPPVQSNITGDTKIDFTAGTGAQIVSDYALVVPMELTANILSSANHCKTQERVSVYMYKLDATVTAIENGRGLGAL